MSLSSDGMLKLMAYVDGELEGSERLEAEMLLANDPDAATFIEQVADLGKVVELGYQERRSKTIAAFDVTAAVMGAIGTQASADMAPATSITSNVRSLSDIRRARGAAGGSGGGLKIGVAVAAALALAASVFVFTQHRKDEAPMAVAPAPAVQQLSGSSGVAVESAGKSVSVFYLPTESELSTSVLVWVDETGEK